MIQALREWLVSIVMLSFLISLLRLFLPEGNLRKAGAFTGSLVLMAAILRPLVRLEPERFDWGLESYESAITERMEEFQANQETAFREMVAERSAEVIVEKAAELGAAVSVRVETRTENGTPLPQSVTLDGPWNAALSEWMRVALDIPPERQEWRESNPTG